MLATWEIPRRTLGETGAVLIAGPTGSGKSALALRIAEQAAACGRQPAIINADSIQVYEGLNILTARPEPEALARVPHLLYGHVPPEERYSVGRWLADARREIGDGPAHRLPIVVGGTGLYFEALLSGIAAIPEVPDTIRVALAGRLAAEGPERLHKCLARRDPAVAAVVRPSDRQRILRALEVREATGRSIAEWQQDASSPLVDSSGAIRLLLNPPRDVLYGRIEGRLDAMVAVGVLDEVQALLSRRLDPELPVMKAIGIKEFSAVLANQIPLEEALTAAKTRSRRYAKRQLTWFRNRMADWAWLES